jgi:hypothetical protein
MHHSARLVDALGPDLSGAGLLPAPELLSSADLSDALVLLVDAPPRGETVVELEAPPAPALRAFLQARGRASGGWLNRGWALPLEELGALASVAADCGPHPARVYRHDGDAGRLWVIGGERRAPPAHDRPVA